jgi:hypothetical protein
MNAVRTIQQTGKRHKGAWLVGYAIGWLGLAVFIASLFLITANSPAGWQVFALAWAIMFCGYGIKQLSQFTAWWHHG